MSGSCINARTIIRRCCWPPESSDIFEPALSERPSRSSSSYARFVATSEPMPKYAAWNWRFSSTLRLRSAFGRCGTTPIVCRTRTESLTTSAPATIAFPEVGSTRVVRMAIAVVLPAPFGPSNPKNSPA